MNLVRYAQNDSEGTVGLFADSKVVPLSSIAPDAPTDMRDVIANWDQLKGALVGFESSNQALDLENVTLLAPIAAPEKILAIGLNYGDHVEETKAAGMEIPTHQVWFCKQPNSVNSPNGDIELPKVSDKLDYEVELVAVIGKAGRHITRENARKHVFGYAVGNDFTVRDVQWKTPQWMLGKSFDTHAPFGPAIVTADEISDPHELGIRCYVNGELRQSSNTKHLIFNIWDQIAELSVGMTLKPGDIIFTGTPGGVGFGFKPPKPLVAGDIIRSEVDEVGVIENKVIPEV